MKLSESLTSLAIWFTESPVPCLSQEETDAYLGLGKFCNPIAFPLDQLIAAEKICEGGGGSFIRSILCLLEAEYQKDIELIEEHRHQLAMDEKRAVEFFLR